MSVETLNRTLEQELFALLRGASLECLVCGEFVLRRGGAISCAECGTPKGRTLGKPQAAKADEKWHRKETASGEDSPETPKVRVKRWGKSPPALW